MERVSVPSRLALTSAAALVALVGSLGAPTSVAAPPAAPAPVDAPGESSILGHPGQTSDGVPGLPVGPPTTALSGLSAGPAARIRNDVSYTIAPGISVRTWVQVDGRRPIGRVRMNLVSVDLNAPDISFEYLAPKYVPRRFPVSTLGRWNNALVAVNGDFFDIGDTGAPLGIGVSRTRRLVNGGRSGWIPENMSLWFNAAGPRIGPLSVQWAVKQRPRWQVSGVNQPTVPAGSIGAYTPAWGNNPGRSVTEGHRRTRELIVRNGRVIANRPRLSEGRRIRKGELLFIGVGNAARQMRTLPIGRRLAVKRSFVGGRPKVAITGDRPLLVNGVRRVINNRLAHPRTAVGIDRDGRRLLLLVVEGRLADSRGYTMVELANMMAALGAEDALNLDGGGSSTMWSRLQTGEMGLVSRPSDGVERRVPNGLGVVYHGELPPVDPPLPEPVPTSPPPTAPPESPPPSP